MQKTTGWSKVVNSRNNQVIENYIGQIVKHWSTKKSTMGTPRYSSDKYWYDKILAEVMGLINTIRLVYVEGHDKTLWDVSDNIPENEYLLEADVWHDPEEGEQN
tara:strand:- start:395 stop:706 length:312 start_codon:yes stop_codon:yes gene_type:complete